MCVDPVTDASSFPYRPSFDGGLAWCTGAVSCGCRHPPFPGRRTPRPGPALVRVCVLFWPGPAGWPPGHILVRLTFSCGRSWCPDCLLGPLWAGVALLVVCPAFFPFWAPLVSGVSCLPALGALGLGVFCPPPFLVFLFLLLFFPFLPFLRPPCLRRSVFSGPGCLGPWRPVPPPPPLLVFSFFFFPALRPPCLRRSVFSGPGCLGFWRLAPPPSVVLCPLLCFVVPRFVWCRGLWCVLCCDRWSVRCLCRVGFLRRVVWRGVVPGRVVLFLSCFAALRCCVLCWYWALGWFRLVSVSVLCLCGAVLVCLHRCSLCGAPLPLRRWLVFCVVACCVCVFAVGPGCPLLSPDGSWWLLVSCFGRVLWCVPGCCAAPCCCAL